LVLTVFRLTPQVNMHLTCTNQSQEVCDAGLAGAKEAGIRNIVALRGDPPKGQERWEATEGGFGCALDLVKYMRANYGDYFSIQVRRGQQAHGDFTA
jgi:methylenetetrahydrofolate reductase (NADPH)